jgi:PAS domain S-box-containing protein
VESKEKNEDFYKRVFDSLKEFAIYTTDKERIITSWNEGAKNILLYTADEIIGQSVDILYLPQDLKEKVPAVEMTTAIREGMAINERFHLKKGGIQFWGSGLVFPLYNEKNEHIGFTKTMQNISEQPQAEMNLNEEKALASIIVSSSDEPIIILSSNLEVITATPSFINLFSLDREHILGKNFYQIIDGGLNIAQVRTNLDSILKNHDFHGNFEVDYAHPKHGARSLSVKARRIYQAPNLLFKLEFEDLTHMRNVSDEKDTFISVASHEVKTPLSIIKAYGQILDRELKEASPLVRMAVNKVNEQTGKMTTLLNALLNTSKITTGTTALNLEIFNLCTLVSDIVEDFNVAISTHQVIIGDKADAIVNADKTQTGAIITNLLTNAIKYSPHSSEVIVHIRADQSSATVSVQDFGMGIAKSEQSSVFQRFARAENAKKSKIPGFGLGLYLSSEMIKMQGGEIGFTSEEGKGSTFFFTMPVYSE